MARLSTTFSPTPVPALVAQWIEQRFPKPCVAGSIPAGGTKPCRARDSPGLLPISISLKARLAIRPTGANRCPTPSKIGCRLKRLARLEAAATVG
jgi:hypothetical protein